MEIEDRKAEPPPEKRGDIARTYFYMDWAYPGHGVISKKNRKLFKAWDKEDPVDAWECERCRRIEKIQKNENPFVRKACVEKGCGTYQEIIFQIKEDEPDDWAIGVLFTLSLMSFTFAAPRGISEIHFIPDEDWSLEYFLQGLRYRWRKICFTSDYVSGRLMKTDIDFESGGKVKIVTRNRGRGAERWLTHLQGKKHINPVK